MQVGAVLSIATPRLASGAIIIRREPAMNDEREPAHHAQVGDLHLGTWNDEHRYFWSARNTRTHQQLGTGEANSLDAAKRDAIAAAGLQGRAIKWLDIAPPL